MRAVPQPISKDRNSCADVAFTMPTCEAHSAAEWAWICRLRALDEKFQKARLHVEEGEKALLPLARTYAQVVAACDGVCGPGAYNAAAQRARPSGDARDSETAC